MAAETLVTVLVVEAFLAVLTGVWLYDCGCRARDRLEREMDAELAAFRAALHEEFGRAPRPEDGAP